MEEMLSFLDNSPTAYQAVAQIKNKLQKEGFIELSEMNSWSLEKGKSYYLTRNQSSIVAFKVGKNLDNLSFKIVASHSDAPSFKVKPKGSMMKDGYQCMNVEPYGGAIYSTWMDRPLSIAGRVVIMENNTISSKLVDIKEPVAMMMNLPIHFNREVNQGKTEINAQIDLVPLTDGVNYMEMLAKHCNCSVDAIMTTDLYVYPVSKALTWGEYVSSYHLDDLQCAYTTLCGFLQASNDECISMYCCFDNEEVGSLSRQGAASSLLLDTCKQCCQALNVHDEFHQIMAKSMLVSADNAQGYLPNKSEKYDANHRVMVNQGIVIKYSGNLSYSSDAWSSALFLSVLKKLNIPVQFFANRSDIRGGSTLGSLSTSLVSIPTVDIGLAQWAMHSACETAGLKDCQWMVEGITAFYQSSFKHISADKVELL